MIPRLLLCVLMLSLTLSFVACGSGGGGSSNSPLSVTTTSLPSGVTNAAYNATLIATGGKTPYAWSLANGSLPAGLSLSRAGNISGTPTATGSSSFAVAVADSQNPPSIATATFSLVITPAVQITTSNLFNGSVGIGYSETLAATGGVAPYSWMIIQGSLPQGLTFNPSGLISGTPTTSGTSSLTVQVSDSEMPAMTATVSLSITINPAGGILTNGDFSKGFACYTMNPIGKNNGNAWQFYLTESTYSAEIYCSNGTYCDRAAIYTSPIPVDINSLSGQNMSYEVSFSYECPVTGSAQFSIETFDDSQNITYLITQGLTCNGLQNQVTNFPFTPGLNQTSMVIAFGDESSQTLTIDNVVLTYSNGTAPQQVVDYAGVRPGLGVVNGNNPVPYVTVGGSPYFALGFYNVPPSDYPAAKAAGANTLLSTESVTPTNKCSNTTQIIPGQYQDYRDWALKNGLNLIPNSMYAVRPGTDNNGSHGINGTAGELTLPSIANTYAPHQANIAWSLADEPDIHAIPWFYLGGPEMVTLGQIANQYMSLPKFAMLNNPGRNPGNRDSNFHIADYNGSTDIWGAAPYGDDWDQVGGTGFTHVNNALNVFDSVLPLRPIWFAMDGNVDTQDPPQYHAELIVPKAYYSIINGVTGILYFDWTTFNNDDVPSCTPHVKCLLNAAGQVFSELNDPNYNLGDAIVSGSLVAATSGEGLPVTGRGYQLKTYVIAVNLTTSTIATAHFSVPGLENGKFIDVDFGTRTLTSSAGGFVDNRGFASLGRHVYVITN